MAYGERMNRAPADAPNGTGSAADKVLEYAYLFILAFFTLSAFRNTTMLDSARLSFTYAMPRGTWVLAGLIAGARIARDRPWSLRDVALGVLICCALIRSWQHVERSYIFELAILIVGAHGIDFGKIIRVHFFAVAAALAVTMILALAGVIENLVYYRLWTSRMAFGIIYPTDFAAQVFFLAAAWAWIRGRRITWIEIVVFIGVMVFLHVFCDARNSVMCLGLMTAGLAYLKLRREAAARRGRTYSMSAVSRWLCVLAAPLLAAVMLVLSLLYNDGPFMAKLNELISDRFYFGHLAFRDYAVTLFGQDVPMEGLGGTTLPGEGYYFFLDSSYINMLFCFGAVTLVVLLAAYAMSASREKNNRSWERLGILAAAALQCASEHHFIELAYNPFLLLTLAVSLPEREEEPLARRGTGGGRHAA